ncbi:zinc finger and BTB domain-containing protein 11-like [Diaphorina citri]|uniref:Zinc finger and BTB domain-containing protein 11-like n=1 Tax=Diaphorina citri TaxID=121845 RepID=A0A1S4ET40_DIACI|nr:zinc finger and BTB domain-containing protein 11-like [Diaphorina citri]
MRFYEFNTYVTHVHETHAILPRVIVTKFKVEDFQFFVCEKKCLDNTVQFDDVLLKKNPSLVRKIKSGEPIKSPETKIENSNLTNTSSMTIPKLTVSIKTSKLKQVIECKARNKKGKKIMRKLFKCDICGKMFNMFKSWHNHLSIHSIPCNFCKMRFYEFNTYVTHVHETHAILPRVIVTKFKVEDFQFFVCESMQSAKSTCVLCKKVFSTRENCTNHIMECHSYDVFEWKDKGVIKEHINPLFLKKFAFALNCPVCKLYFDRESDFHSHMQSYHNSHSYCMKCNMYIFNSRLQLHKRKHTREEEQWTKVNIEYSCDCCEMSWSNPKDFGQHLNLVKCSYCANAAFCSSKALTRHLVEEHSDKLCGVCTFCDNGFCSAQDLLEHMLLTHCYGYFPIFIFGCVFMS